MNPIIVNLSLLLFILLFFSFLNFRKNENIISLGVAFNGYALLYFFLGIILYENLINHWHYNLDLILISKLTVVSVLAFNLCYMMIPKVIKDSSYIPTKEIVVFACLVGILSQILMIVLIGPIEFFTMDRVRRFSYFDKYKILLLLSGFMYIGFVMSAMRYYLTGNNQDKQLLKLMFGIILIYAIATVSRTHLTIIAITVGVFIERKNIVSKKNILISFFIIAFVMLFFKGFLYNIFFSELSYETFNPGEFINWIRNTIMVINSPFYTTDGSGFDSYLLTIKSLFVISPDGEPLSQWFINEFYSDNATAGLTYGFSGIAEGYLAIGYLGVAAHFATIGMLFGHLDKRKSFISLVLMIFLIFLTFRIFRSESYNIVRTFSWYYLYPLLVLVVMDKVLRKI